MLKIIDLLIEYRNSPIGLDVNRPRFSWVIDSDNNETMQTSYNIKVETGGSVVWDSGEVTSDQSVHIEYEGAELLPSTIYNLTVNVRDNHDESAAAVSSFETGLLDHTNIKAEWITSGFDEKEEALSVFFRGFELAGEVESARVYASALGIYELTLNGSRVGNAYFAPGWTNYKKRIQYQTYDITGLLKKDNRIEMTVGNGWYKGIFGFEDKPNHYGSRVAALAQILIKYRDGRSETIVSDGKWGYTEGVRRYAEFYHGEVIDYTFDVSKARTGAAVPFSHPTNILVAQENEPVTVVKKVNPKKLIITPKGEVVMDFGQNLVGVVEARIRAPKGTAVTLRHAEVLDKDGNYYTENLRGAKAADTFICSGSDDVFMASFIFHGFRYLQIEGLGNEPDLDSFTACVMHSDMRETGTFSCSDSGVTQLQSNILWGMRGNFVDVPTDCPQRNERLGWTADAQVFASTAAFNMNTALFFTKWLRDLKSEQTEEFGVPHVVPNILGDKDGAAAWSDAAVIIPWTMYLTYGDKRLLAEQFDSMKGWVEYIRSKTGANQLWQSGFQYGDWLALDTNDESLTGATDVYFVANAYYAYSVSCVALAAEVLGYEKEADMYRRLHTNILDAFRKEYITQNGRMVSETQTGCILALYFGLAQPEHRARILETLIANLSEHNEHLTTGFVGTPYLCHLLSESGRHEIAGKIFLKRDFPSWLYAVERGATTIWERWDSIKQDGSFGDPSMNSFNHYAYGAIGAWMYEKIAGLQIAEPGYKKTRIAPQPIKGITWADASIFTMYGKLSCRWECKERRFIVDITVPANTTAIILLPGTENEIEVGSGNYHYEYETDLELEQARWSMDSTLGEVMDNPIALAIMKQYAPEAIEHPGIRHALHIPISKLTGVMPPESLQLFEMIFKQLNEAERKVDV